MNRKLLIYSVTAVVAVVALVAGIVGYVSQGNKGYQQATTTEAPVASVEITASGFVPATIAVDPGTKVVWTNKDSAPHQVSSDPHPDHSKLPGLHAENPLSSEETYSYTFNASGSWTYHDYLNPTVTGTVIVR